MGECGVWSRWVINTSAHLLVQHAPAGVHLAGPLSSPDHMTVTRVRNTGVCMSYVLCRPVTGQRSGASRTASTRDTAGYSSLCGRRGGGLPLPFFEGSSFLWPGLVEHCFKRGCFQCFLVLRSSLERCENCVWKLCDSTPADVGEGRHLVWFHLTD